MNPEEKDHSPVINTEKPAVKKKNFFRENLSTIAILIFAPLTALFMINFVFQTYEVDGPSMETTLADNDRLIVTKTGKTMSRITREDYIPDRYDIIVFNHRGDFGFGDKVTQKQLIKRVIGVPGDRVVVKDGIVTVYNKQNPDGFLVDRAGPESKVIGVTNGNIDQTIKNGEIFAMGDNRDNSLDSRVFGTVTSSDIVGKLALRIYPFDKTQRF